MGKWGGEIAPANHAEAVTPHDSTNFTAGACEYLYVGGAGVLVVVLVGGATVTFAAVPAGTTIPVRAIRVNATSTTATSIVALYTRG